MILATRSAFRDSRAVRKDTLFFFPLGSRQVVRHRILIPAFVGSIPTSPATSSGRQAASH
jgi:hypothetical protein